MASNAERLDALYERFWKQGDWHAGAEVMSPDIEWNTMSDDAVLGGTTRYGPRAVNEFFAEWLDAWEAADVRWEITELTPDLLLVRSSLHARGRGSGLDTDAEIGQIWEFENGQAVREHMYRRFEDARAAADEMLQTRGS
jgi:ketosteroid isomerase-like protein